MVSDFHPVGADADFLHAVPFNADRSLTETLYFAFHIPEHELIGQVYVWFHPALKVVSAGVWVWRGLCRELLAAEYFDYRSFLPYPTSNLDDCTLANGMHFRVIEPLQQYRFDYEDKTQGMKLHLLSTGVTPPVSRSNVFDFEAKAHNTMSVSGGLEQLMQVDGELVLHGKTYRIDCLKVRDRSWGQVRPEAPMPIPAMGWTSVAFGPDFCFSAMSYDEPGAETAEMRAALRLPEPGKGLVKGWIYRDGEVRQLVRLVKHTEREELIPVAHQLELEDSTGRIFKATSKIVSTLPFHAWQNMTCHWGLSRYECDGRTGWGESQDCQWADYVRLSRAVKPAR